MAKNFTNSSAIAAEAFLTNTDNVDQILETTPQQAEKSQNHINSVDRSVSRTFTFQKKDLEDVVNTADRFLGLRKKVNQSEIVRMGISLIKRLDDSQLLEELEHLYRASVGRKSSNN